MALYEMRKFVAPEFIFGVGSRRRAAYYARHLMARRVLVVSDPGVIAAGWLKDVQDDLTEAGIESVVFHALTPNAKDHEVMAGAAVYARERCDVIVAIGGGSVIDCAKAIGIVHANGRHVLAFEGVDQVEVPGPPLICIPTTAGTAADISQFCIIANTAGRYKMAIISKTVVPDVALVDPETTLSMNPYLTACTGLDALTHAIEAFVGNWTTPYSDGMALSAVGLIFENLRTAYTNGKNLEAREKMALASTYAGFAFTRANVGYVHAIAHQFGGLYHTAHGLANAIMLPHVLKYSAPVITERLALLAIRAKVGTEDESSDVLAQKFLDAVDQLNADLGIPTCLDALKESDIPALAKAACHEAHTGYPVPRYMSQAQCENLIRQVLPHQAAHARKAKKAA